MVVVVVGVCHPEGAHWLIIGNMVGQASLIRQPCFPHLQVISSKGFETCPCSFDNDETSSFSDGLLDPL